MSGSNTHTLEKLRSSRLQPTVLPSERFLGGPTLHSAHCTHSSGGFIWSCAISSPKCHWAMKGTPDLEPSLQAPFPGQPMAPQTHQMASQALSGPSSPPLLLYDILSQPTHCSHSRAQVGDRGHLQCLFLPDPHTASTSPVYFLNISPDHSHVPASLIDTIMNGEASPLTSSLQSTISST